MTEPEYTHDPHVATVTRVYPTAICTRRRCKFRLERDAQAEPAAKQHVRETGHTVEVVRTQVTSIIGVKRGEEPWRRL